MSPSYRDAVTQNVSSPRRQLLEQPRPRNDDELTILALYAANTPLNKICDAILRACPPPPPTTELVLETNGELRTTLCNTILESLLTDQTDNPELHTIIDAGAVVQIVKHSDGNLVLRVTANTVIETTHRHRMSLCGNTYTFRARAAIDQRFFFNVVNFMVTDDVDAPTLQLLKAGFKVVSCASKICGRRQKTSTPMIRVYTADSTIPDCATVNGRLMDQLVLDGKTFTVNCKGSRSGANPRMQSPHCLVLAIASPEQEDHEGEDNMPPDEGAADGDVDMQSPSKTTVELTRTAAPATDYKPLASEHL